jgi:preprotein translocase subunit SecE
LYGNIGEKAPKGLLKKLMFSKLVNFLKEVKMEVKKINWPDKNKTIKYTMVVLGISFVIAVYLGGLDFLFTFLLEKFVI